MLSVAYTEADVFIDELSRLASELQAVTDTLDQIEAEMDLVVSGRAIDGLEESH